MSTSSHKSPMSPFPADWVTPVPGRRDHIYVVLAAVVLAVAPTARAQLPPWTGRGPSPIMPGPVSTVDREVVGAINALVPDPTNADVLYVGAVNGGVWKTTNATATRPTWTPLTDFAESLSIGALELDPTDATNQTLVGGIGGFSSFFDRGPLTGLLRTTDGGANWAPIDGGAVLDGLNISGVAPRGAVIAIAATFALTGTANRGIWRTTDLGATWIRISGGATLPAGPAYDLVGDPGNPNRLFTNAGATGLFRSDDIGGTWTKVSDAALDAQIASASNVEIAVGTSGNVYVAVVASASLQLSAVFRSGDGGAPWTAMDLPASTPHPGGQGDIHLSIAADPTNANFVYVGGDYGPRFRGDASQPSGSQWATLAGASSGAGGTINNTRPHADTRDLKFSANGDLFEVDDGGIYRRTNPRTNNGDWSSVNGNLMVTEFHSIAWDTKAKILFGGTQDNDTPQQVLPSGSVWGNVSGGDGGVVATDAVTAPGHSTRFVSAQRLSNFQRRLYDASNVLISVETPTRLVLDGGAAPVAQFYTPIRLNNVDPRRMIIGAFNSVYESSDHAETLREIAPGLRINDWGRHAIAYGATANPDMLYVGVSTQVYVRSAAHPAPLTASPTYAAGFVRGIALDPGNAQTAFVVGGAGAATTRVYQTTDAGATWTNITGNLSGLNPGLLRSVAYTTSTPTGAVVVGSDAGVFTATGPAFTSWSQLSTGLPRAPVLQLEYAQQDDLLVAGTLGRGAWTLNMSTAPPVGPWTDDGTVVRLTTRSDLVGVGTATPGGKLHVDVDGDGDGDFYVEDDGPRRGNVGVGTTSPLHKLTLGDQTTTAPANYVQVNAAAQAGIVLGGGGGGRGAEITYNHAQDYLGFRTSPPGATAPWGEHMRITAAGNVGIGTPNPGASRLAVVGNTSVTGDLTATGNVGFGGPNPGPTRLLVAGDAAMNGLSITSAAPLLRLNEIGEGRATLRFTDAGASTTETFEIAFDAADQDLHFRSDEKEMMTLTNDGIIFFTPRNLHNTHPSLSGSQFAIAWNQTGGRGETDFYQHGGAGWRSGYDFWTQRDAKSLTRVARIEDTGNLRLLGSVGSLSDGRLKTNVRAIADAARKVTRLRGVYFNWRPGEGPDQDNHLGLIAQEVLEVVPEVVIGGPTREAEDEPYSLNYAGLVPLLIEAVKQQQSVIDNLTQRLARLEARIGLRPQRP